VASERIIPIQAAQAAYDVNICPGLLDAVGEQVRRFTNARRALVVGDRNLVRLYWPRLKKSLEPAGFSPTLHDIPAGEESKSLEMLSATYDGFLALPVERCTPVIAFGGGMTTDLAGFAAATLLRGLPFIPIPTSLLAMVDASIGGKTGINHAVGKNLIGAFHQPSAVLIDPEVLATLPPRELRNGLAEVIKHYAIRDAAGFARLEQRLPQVLAADPATLAEIIAENVAIKAAVVEADPFESGERAHLNFGHTFGHAFEKASDYALSHGEAVALGMCAAVQAALELGMIDSEARDRLIRLVAAAGLPIRTDQVDPDTALEAMRSDKKVVAGSLRFILPERIGSVVIRGDVPPAVVRSALASVCV
jgi:3-dehydroquinate synthase